MPHRAKHYFPELAGTAASTLGAITSLQEHLMWAVQLAGGLVALTAGLLTIRSLLRKEAPRPKD